MLDASIAMIVKSRVMRNDKWKDEKERSASLRLASRTNGEQILPQGSRDDVEESTRWKGSEVRSLLFSPLYWNNSAATSTARSVGNVGSGAPGVLCNRRPDTYCVINLSHLVGKLSDDVIH